MAGVFMREIETNSTLKFILKKFFPENIFDIVYQYAYISENTEIFDRKKTIYIAYENKTTGKIMLLRPYNVKSYKDLCDQIIENLSFNTMFTSRLIVDIMYLHNFGELNDFYNKFDEEFGDGTDNTDHFDNFKDHLFDTYLFEIMGWKISDQNKLIRKVQNCIKKNYCYTEILDMLCCPYPYSEKIYRILEDGCEHMNMILDIYMKTHIEEYN